jgi:uncharacterized membrane protein YgcG
MHEIIRPADVHKLSKEEKREIIERGHLDKKYKDYDCFYDETSYWFMRKSRSRSRSSGSNSSGSGTKKSKSKGKGKSKKTYASGGGSSGGW